MPDFDLYTRPHARRPAVLDDLLALAEAGQQAAVDAAILMLADLYELGAESRYAKKLQGLPLWELKTQARGGAKGGMRVYFYFRANGQVRILSAESKSGDKPSSYLISSKKLFWLPLQTIKGGTNMPKTAQEWKDLLNLEDLPDSEFLDALNALEDKEVIGRSHDPPGEVSMTPTQLAEAVFEGSVGDALKRIREHAGLTTREAGEALGTSHARISQMERPDSSLNLMTVTRTAQRLGYRTKLVFEPEEDGPVITAPLPGLMG